MQACISTTAPQSSSIRLRRRAAIRDGLETLGLADLPQVLRLQAIVAEGLPSGFLLAKPEAELVGYLDGSRGWAQGIFVEDRLSALGLLRLPEPASAPAGPAFPGVPARDWPGQVAFLENSMVHPDARGQGYQRRLLEARLTLAALHGKRWLCAGVHLRNTVSWKNLLAGGLAIVGLRMDRGYPLIGLLRGLQPASLRFEPGDALLVPAQDAGAHQAALDSGFIGVSLGSQGSVHYHRLSA